MAKIALNGTGIHAIIRQFVTAAMPQHMRVDFRVKAGRSGRAFHHGLETTLSPRSLAKYEGRFGARFFAEIACENVGTTIGFPDLVMREGRQMYGARPCERIVPSTRRAPGL